MTHTASRVCHALVPCAGLGLRSGASVPKQYVSLAGHAVVAHTLNVLSKVARLSSILVVLHPDDCAFADHVTAPPARLAAVRCGGTTRAETVANGLEQLLQRGAAVDDWVLVHDAARCLVRVGWIDHLIDACLNDEVGGLLAVPVADTLKRETDGRVSATLERRATWQAQTPQMFRLQVLRAALSQAARDDTTDEASAVEKLGLMPKLVMGSLENFKLTHASDFALAEHLLRARG